MTTTVICAADTAVPAALDGLVVTRAENSRDSMRAGVAKAVADAAVTRVVVVAGTDHPDAFLGAVVARLMIAEALDVEVAYVAPEPTPGTAVYGLPSGSAAIELALTGTAVALPLIRDDAAVVVIGQARHTGPDGTLHGESIVDSERLFLGNATTVLIRPTRHEPGVEGAVLKKRWQKRFRQKWVAGRAVQTGGDEVVVERDGITAPRPVHRSTIYRHNEDWKLVCP